MLGRKRKYHFTEPIDNKLREIYESRDLGKRKNRTLPTLHQYADQLHWSKCALIRRGVELGLARPKEKPWSKRELQLLKKLAHYSGPVIARKFHEQGLSRSATAIHVKLNRTKFRQKHPYYSATHLASAMGVDIHKVTDDWIHKGLLNYIRKGTERTEQQGGDTYLIHEKDIREFLCRYPREYDIRKVDQLWFLNILLLGNIGKNYNKKRAKALFPKAKDIIIDAEYTVET